MMTYKDLQTVLGWHLRSGRGFYCDGLKFTGINANDDGTVDLNNYKENYFIMNAKVESVNSFSLRGKMVKYVIISEGDKFGC